MLLKSREQVIVANDARRADPDFDNRPATLPSCLRTTLTRIAVGDGLSPCGVAEAFKVTVGLLPPVRDVVLGSLMTAVMARGPVPAEVVALLRGALDVDGRPAQQEVTGTDRPVIVLAGSGKKGRRTLNVSTPAALVAAAAGARVIKVGSSATSSALGSRDLICALGLPECRSEAGVRSALATSGLAFVAIEPAIPTLDHVYGGRFHTPNPFSFGLAPLASPVRGDITVFGLSHPRVDVAAEVLSAFGQEHVDVICTRLPTGQYLDEISPVGEVRWCRVRSGLLSSIKVQPADEQIGNTLGADLPVARGASEATELVGDLLSGGGVREHRLIVSLNAAHLLVLSSLADSMRAGVAIADDILRRGEALGIVTRSMPIEGNERS